MGIRLIVEVLDYAPTTLTHRERLLAVVLAEDANDDTRQTWNSVARTEVLRRARLSRTQLYDVLKALAAAGVIKKVTAGQKNATAKYEFLPLDPQSPVQRDTDTPSQHPAPQDTEQPQRPAHRDPDGKFSVPESGTLTDSQCPAGRDFSVPLDGTPTPQPLTTPTTSDAPATPVTAQTITGEWLERVTKRPPSTVIGQVSKQIRLLLDDGIDPDDVRRGIALWMTKGLHPSVLPAVVNEAMNRAAPPARPAARYTDPAERGIF